MNNEALLRKIKDEKLYNKYICSITLNPDTDIIEIEYYRKDTFKTVKCFSFKDKEVIESIENKKIKFNNNIDVNIVSYQKKRLAITREGVIAY